MSDPIGAPAAAGTYDDDELDGWDGVGSSPCPFADRLRAAERARLLRLAIAGSYGAAVERGLAWADAQAALSLAATLTVDRDQHEAKRLTLREHVDGTGDGLMAAMVRAALDHDEARLGLVGARSADRILATADRRSRTRQTRAPAVGGRDAPRVRA